MLCHAVPQNSTQMSSNYEAIVIDSEVAGAGHLLRGHTEQHIACKQEDMQRHWIKIPLPPHQQVTSTFSLGCFVLPQPCSGPSGPCCRQKKVMPSYPALAQKEPPTSARVQRSRRRTPSDAPFGKPWKSTNNKPMGPWDCH